jgi:hypothetical protein
MPPPAHTQCHDEWNVLLICCLFLLVCRPLFRMLACCSSYVNLCPFCLTMLRFTVLIVFVGAHLCVLSCVLGNYVPAHVCSLVRACMTLLLAGQLMLKLRGFVYLQASCALLLELEMLWGPRVINCPQILHGACSLRATKSEHLCFQLS